MQKVSIYTSKYKSEPMVFEAENIIVTDNGLISTIEAGNLKIQVPNYDTYIVLHTPNIETPL